MKIWSLDFDELVVSKLFWMIEKISLCAWNNDIFQSNIQFFLKLILILKIYYWGKKYYLVGLVVNEYWQTSSLFLSLCPSLSHPLLLLPLLPISLHSFSPFLSLLLSPCLSDPPSLPHPFPVPSPTLPLPHGRWSVNNTLQPQKAPTYRGQRTSVSTRLAFMAGESVVCTYLFFFYSSSSSWILLLQFGFLKWCGFPQ